MEAVADVVATQEATLDRLYLVVLEGGGDIFVALVTQSVWDWIDQPFLRQASGYYEDVPAAVLAEAEKHGNLDWFANGQLRISIGSYDNDRAMAAPGLKFDDVEEAEAYAAQNKVKIEGTYEGYLY